jgi:L-alanine-DL-glutamate epimerase-like enolase superfamily enzyme
MPIVLRRVEVIPVRIPLPRAFPMTAAWTIDAAYIVLVRLTDEDGLVGVGYSVMYNRRFHRPLTVTTEALSGLLQGARVASVEQTWNWLYASLAQTGAQGIASLALGAIDVALWDLAGKRAGQPVFRLLGAVRDRVDVYASATYFLQLPSDDAFVEAASALTARGFRSLKIDFPHQPGPKGSAMKRIERLREAVGDDIGLMIDCTQGWTEAQATRWGRELEPYGLTWIEDPLPEADLDGHARLAAALDTPIATGEWAFSAAPLYEWARRRAADVIIGDVLRIGGLTPWKGLAAVTSAHHIALASHLYSEVSQHALAASPTALLLEFADWAFPLLQDPPTITDGSIVLSEAPGLGFSVDESSLKHHRCD